MCALFHCTPLSKVKLTRPRSSLTPHTGHVMWNTAKAH